MRDSVLQADFGVSIDLTDAYFHILVHKKDRKRLRFVWDNKVYQYRALPFGLAPAPWIFTKVVRELIAALRVEGIRIKAFLDDWLVLAQSQVQCKAHSLLMLKKCQALRFQVNFVKSDLSPSQTFTYLGMLFNTVCWTVAPSNRRIQRLLDLINRLLLLPQAPAHLLYSLLGTMESLSPLVVLGRANKRQFQREVNARWSQAHQSWKHLVRLGPWLKTAVSQWLDLNWLEQGVPITLDPPQEAMFTDASTKGWGAHMGDLSAAGLWSPQQKLWHINSLELEAVVLALQEFLPLASGKHIRVHTTNTTVACYLNKQGGARSPTLSQKVESLLRWCHAHAIQISAVHISGRLNILADSLSRSKTILQTEWTLVKKVLIPVWEAWFQPQVDLFATRYNHRLPVYVSPAPDPGALASDALSISWSGLLGYAFPPLPLMGKVLKKAREDNARLILIAPKWPAQAWFPDLLHLTHVPPLKLLVKERSLVQPRSGVPHKNPSLLNLHAWLLCGNRCQH